MGCDSPFRRTSAVMAGPAEECCPTRPAWRSDALHDPDVLGGEAREDRGRRTAETARDDLREHTAVVGRDGHVRVEPGLEARPRATVVAGVDPGADDPHHVAVAVVEAVVVVLGHPASELAERDEGDLVGLVAEVAE